MANNCNPVLTAMELLDILDRLKEAHSMLAFRIDQLRDEIHDHCGYILKHLYKPKVIRAQVKQRDLFNNNALYYMEKLDSFRLLDTKVMDRIMKDYWSSNVDSSGSFFACSTAFNILTTFKLSNIQDYESKHRFYHSRSFKNLRPHAYIYKVFLMSMQQRYFIEILVFLIMAIAF